MKVDLVTADTGPLIHLASIGELGLLEHFGAVHIPDLVVLEAVYPGKPFAEEIRAWLVAGAESGRVKIAETSIGKVLQDARVHNPKSKLRDGGEMAILEWLLKEVDGNDKSALVIYENGSVPKMIQNHSADLSAAVVTTRTFFSICEKEGITKSADKLWEKLMISAPNTNPARNISLHGKISEDYQP